jgi:1-acyl-sn-glycerol-3-phosphate acyltransferase
MEPVYSPVIGLAISLFTGMGWKVHVSGAEHVPKTGAAVLASNHIGYLDFVVVGFGAREAGRLVRFAAKKEVFDHPVAGPLMRGMKHISVDRDGDVNAVMEESHRRLLDGQVVGMFPEGTISRSFMPAEAKTGTARMAMRAGAPLIPTAVWGCHRLTTKAVKRNMQRGVEIRCAFGPAVAYEPDEDARDVTKRLMAAITELLVGLQEAYTQSPAGPEDTWWLPAHLGGTAPTPEEAQEIIRQERIARRKRRQAQGEPAGPLPGDVPDIGS